MSDINVFYKIGMIVQAQTVEFWIDEESTHDLFEKHERVKNSIGSRIDEKLSFVVYDKNGRKISVDLQQVSFIMVLE